MTLRFRQRKPDPDLILDSDSADGRKGVTCENHVRKLAIVDRSVPVR